MIEGPEPVALSEPVLSGFLRIVTDRRVFRPPTPLGEAMRFVEALTRHPNVRRVRPGMRHWEIFAALVLETGATGKVLADAFHAATALGDFARFTELRWRHPLAPGR